LSVPHGRHFCLQRCRFCQNHLTFEYLLKSSFPLAAHPARISSA
jgi:hypothetical protein